MENEIKTSPEILGHLFTKLKDSTIYESKEECLQQICKELKMEKNTPCSFTLETFINEYLSLENESLFLNQSNQQNLEEKQKQEHEERTQPLENLLKYITTQTKVFEYNKAFDLFSIDLFHKKMKQLTHAFQEISCNHAVAVKSNPIRGILIEAQKYGFGAECASYGEVIHALSLGFHPSKIVYDSPCKTSEQLEELIQKGVYINLDNMDEIQKVDKILKTLNLSPSKQIGIRLNPVIGSGKIKMSSTVNKGSKFGLECTNETKDSLFQLFQTYSWIQGIHIHVGSQGCSLHLLIEGMKQIETFANEINTKLGFQQIFCIDLGGGIPINYNGCLNDERIEKDLPLKENLFEQYATQLKQEIPRLFSGKYQLITEFGRSLFAKCGITISQIEAIKTFTKNEKEGIETRMGILHVGANQFLRTIYCPKQWQFKYSVFNRIGQGKKKNFQYHDLAGPLCFGGDILIRNIYLPQIEKEDFIVLHDTGGYTVSMYSRFNSLPMNAIYGFQKGKMENEWKLYVYKEQETIQETLTCWGLDQPYLLS